MLKKIVIFSILAILLSACSGGPTSFFKRSANNKIFDRTGFNGGKRAPLYNKKYISQAKKNVVSVERDDYDLDEFDEQDKEIQNTSRDNIEMYKAMIEHDLSLDGSDKKNPKRKRNSETFASLIKGKKKIEDDDTDQDKELKKELSQIKNMLKETQKEVANNKCPGIALSPDATASKNKSSSSGKLESAILQNKEKPAPVVRDKKPIMPEPVESL